MKIRSIHLRNVGPLAEYDQSFEDDWKGGLHEMILFSGPNGCGKSTVLRAVSHLWNLTGDLLSSNLSSKSVSSRKWLAQWGYVGIVIESFLGDEPIGVFIGSIDDYKSLRELTKVHNWIAHLKMEPTSRYIRSLFGTRWDMPGHLISTLKEHYSMLILREYSETPNMIHLDGEDRRWVVPTKGLGEVVADDPQLKWLVGYRAGKDWQGQLEASLITQKTLNEDRYHAMIRDLNRFLAPKEIDPQPTQELRLQVKTPRTSDGTHGLDELSAGEHQILIQIYLVSRWLQKGGIVMIDEPDLHLHPSLLSLFLSTLERLVRERMGQLVLTSHNPELWRRYENKGLRIQLGGEL